MDPHICDANQSDDSDDPNPNDEKIRRNLEIHEESKLLTIEDIVVINLGDMENPREVKIGACLPKDVAKRLTQLLKDYQDIFAWSYTDMLGLDRSIVEHCLLTDPLVELVKQRPRRTKPKLAKKIKEEVMKFLDVGFIETTQYLEWVANIVPVLKKDGRV